MSYGLYVGRNHTADGVAYLAGCGDEPSSHWLEIVPTRQHSDGYCRTELLASLERTEIMAHSLEARTRALFGISSDPVPKSAQQIW